MIKRRPIAPLTDKESRMKEHEKSPRTSEEQDHPQQVRMTTPQEQEGQELEELENPPQAEGPRERVEKDLNNREERG